MVTKEKLGTFAAGAIPPPLKVYFVDLDGVAVPLTGWNAFVEIEAVPDVIGPLGAGSVNVTDEAGGEVTYTWAYEDMKEPSSYSMLVWVENAGDTQRYETDLLIYSVYDGPGATP